jgi:hypothetical protein
MTTIRSLADELNRHLKRRQFFSRSAPGATGLPVHRRPSLAR